MVKAGVLGILILILSYASVSSQSIDSLELVLKSSSVGTHRVDVLNYLSDRYLASKPKQARQYAEEALSLAHQLRYPFGQIVALNRIGESEFRQSNYAMAVEYTTRSLKLAEQNKDSAGMAMNYRVLGNIHTFGFKQYDLALQYQLSALKIYEKKKDKRNIASFYGNITWIYANTNQRLDEAQRLARLGVHLSDSLGDRQLLSYNYNSLGLIFMTENQPDSSLLYLDRSIRIASEIEDRAVIAYNKSIKGQVFQQMNNHKKAIELFEAALTESRALNLREVVKKSYEGLAKSNEMLNNYPVAYKNQLLYIQLKDSLVNWETAQRALMTKMKLEEEKREAKITELELDNERARKERMIYRILLGVIFLSVITVAVLVVRNNRHREKANQLLQQKNQEIEEKNRKLQEANDLKDKFFSIIGHDMRSPLVSLKGMLGMVIRNEITEQEFKSFAPKLNQLVIGTDETLENLLQWSRAQMEGLKSNPSLLLLHPIVVKCFQLFAEAAKTKKLALENGVDKSITVYAEPNQVELILRNLIHNAIKFSSEGRIIVSAAVSEEVTEIQIVDSGIGMPAEQLSGLFKKYKPQTTTGTGGEKGTGLGLLLCKEMVENNGGRLSVTSELGRGSTFRVFLKSNE